MTKDEARKRIRQRMEDRPSSVQEVMIARLVTLLSAKKGPFLVLGYQAVEGWREVDISSLPGLLPNVTFDFVPSVKNAPFPTKKYDIILVPLLGFTEDGYRLGHGGGWYDRFLATQPQALKIGVGYEGTLLDFQSEPHDIPMNVVVTEKTSKEFSVK